MKTANISCDSPRNRAALEAYWRRFGVWRASQQADLPTAATGWPRLDRLLPGGGYPLGAITELLVRHAGIGEVSLLLPALAARLKAQPQRRIAFVSPPHRLNAHALAAAGIDCCRVPILHCADDGERVWCVEQMAQSQAFCAFVVWSDTIDARALRRLQLAAEHAGCPLFVHRPASHARQRSPAALRLAISGRRTGQRVEILKCRGPAGACLPGLNAARDMAWQMPEPARTPEGASALKRQCAHNEPFEAQNDPQNNDPQNQAPNPGTSHVARITLSPLGAR